MKKPTPSLLRLFERLLQDVENDAPQMSDRQHAIPVSHYFSAERFEQERAILFRRYPIIVGHESELPAPGGYLRHDALGVPLIITRDPEGHLHCFLNVCRHRGMRLVNEDGICHKKTILCPYHGWTYGLDGRLRGLPHREAFPDLRESERGLVSVPCVSRLGLIWVQPTPGSQMNLDEYLGPLVEELEFFGLADSLVYQRIDTVRAANWKLIIDAFLEAYHIRVLHRDTIYRFFLDAMAVSEPVAPHIRAVAARRRISEARSLPPDRWDLRELCTFTHFVFPNSIFIFHPDYISQISVFPVDPDHLRWTHLMLIPKGSDTEEWRPHWTKTLDLIERTVFQREDLFAAEGMQAGLCSGANQHLTIGRLEFPIRAFHDAIQKALDEFLPPPPVSPG